MPDSVELIQSGEHAERLGALDRALEYYAKAVAGSTDPEIIAEGLTKQADVFRTLAQWDAGIEAARQAQVVARGAGLSDLDASATIAEANVFMCRGDFGAATILFNKVINSFMNPKARGIALQNIGSILAQQRQFEHAE